MCSEPDMVEYSEFKDYMEKLSSQNDTLRFWYQFVSVDCFAYIHVHVALFISLRYRNWELRTGSIKMLAAIFFAFDRSIYQELITQHLKEVLLMPDHILHHLQRGGFSVRKINKDTKLAVVHPSKHRMEFLSNHVHFCSACVDTLKHQLFPERETNKQTFSHAPTAKDEKRETNILTMLKVMKSNDMILLQRMWNVLEGKEATPEQAHDLLNFRRIGQEAFEKLVSYKVIGTQGTSMSTQRKRLLTFTTTKVQKERVKMVEKERFASVF